MRFPLLFFAAGCSLFSSVLSQSVDDCTATVQIVGTTSAPNQIDIPLGTVCVECVVNGAVVAATFQIGNSPIPPSQGTLMGGVLVVYDTNVTFRASPSLILRCFSGSDVRQTSVFLDVYLPPIITGVTTINEGGMLFLICDSTNSNREPLSQWFDKDGQMLSSSGVLNIPNIMRSQAGSYTCRTSPPNLDNSTSTTVIIIVQFAPDVTADRQDLVLVPVGIGTLRISCTYLGIPPPDAITWIHNGTTLVPAADSRISVSFNDTRTTLTITEVTEEEGGMYMCVPQNILGNNSATTEVRIQLPPGPPTDLGVVEDSETTTSLSISWTNPVFSGFSPIDGFTVNLTSRHPDIVRDIPGNAMTMTANLDSLRPFTAYTIRLSVRNAVGLEGEAAVTTGMTDSLLLDKVRDLNAVAVNSTAISVTWTEPTIEPDTMAPVEMYLIRFSSPSRTDTITVTASETSVVLTGLDMGTDYSITVVGINSAGPGASDSDDVATNIDPPSVPQNLNGTSDNPFMISVFWEQPETDGGRPIVRYDLTLTEIGGGPDDVREQSVLANSNLEFTFSGLQQDTGYRVVVTATNSDGSTGPEMTSDPVEISITTLAVGPPQIPDKPTISMITNTSARLSWTDPGGYRETYTLEIRRILDCGNETILRIPGIASESYDQTGLMPLTTYDARILSVNFNGPSNFSDAARFSTVGMVMIGGGEGSVTNTLETTSGDTVTLTCSLDQVENDPETFTWARQDGQPLPEGSTQADGVLTIPGASVEDSGVYVCSASGVQGSFTLSVQQYPEQSSSRTLSTGGVVGITFTITLLVSLPVGVVIGLLLPQAVRRCVGGVRRMKRREGEEDEGDIYEEPDKMATVIPLSQNEAYVLSQQRN